MAPGGALLFWREVFPGDLIRDGRFDLLIERAGLSLLEAETETDRYISWPGQALSYMIGQREIMTLREQLEARDGDRLDRQI